MAEEVKTKPKTNPYGANQYLLDPRQKLCWDSYINPKSETFGNAYQSAIRACYEEDTAKQITVTPWFLEKTRRLNMLGKAEKVLDEMLEMPVEVLKHPRSSPLSLANEEDEEAIGVDSQGYVVTEPALVKIKQDTAKFLAERLGKSEGYATRSEVTGADGKDLIPVDKEAKEKTDAVISDYLNKDD